MDDRILKIAQILTEDPNVFCELATPDQVQPADPSVDAGPQVKNVGTTGYRGTVASTNARYQNALANQKADPKKFIKEVQKIIVTGAKELATNPDQLSKYLKLLKITINADLLKIAAYYRKQQQQQTDQQAGQQQADQQDPLQGDQLSQMQ